MSNHSKPLTTDPADSGWKPELDRMAVLTVVGSVARRPIIEILADGRERIATEVAAELDRDFDAVAKHLRVLREAGVALTRIGEDSVLSA